MRELAVVLVSGGMDSCVVLALAARDHDLALLHVTYGQRTWRRELQSFHALADHYGVSRRLVASIGYLREIGGSSLLDERLPVPEGPPGRGIPSTYVPFRNAHLLAIAASWGEVMGARRIFFGAMEEDSSGYPDCREAFVQAFNRLVEVGTRPETRLEVVAPLLHLRKSEVVRLGVELGAPFELTWSCYQREDRPCGRCESCVLRARAFREAGVPDPLTSAPGR